jgi:hypothetical protein
MQCLQTVNNAGAVHFIQFLLPTGHITFNAIWSLRSCTESSLKVIVSNMTKKFVVFMAP